MEKQAFDLTMVIIPDHGTGKFSAFFAEFPDAIAVGNDRDDVEERLCGLFITMMNDKKKAAMNLTIPGIEYFSRPAKLIFA